MCVLCVCACLHMYRCSCVFMWSPQTKVRCLPWSFSALYIKAQSLTLNPKPTGSANLTATWPWGSCFHFLCARMPGGGGGGAATPTHHLGKLWGSELQSSCSPSKPLLQPPFSLFTSASHSYCLLFESPSSPLYSQLGPLNILFPSPTVNQHWLLTFSLRYQVTKPWVHRYTSSEKANPSLIGDKRSREMSFPQIPALFLLLRTGPFAAPWV